MIANIPNKDVFIVSLVTCVDKSNGPPFSPKKGLNGIYSRGGCKWLLWSKRHSKNEDNSYRHSVFFFFYANEKSHRKKGNFRPVSFKVYYKQFPSKFINSFCVVYKPTEEKVGLLLVGSMSSKVKETKSGLPRMGELKH